MSFKISLLFTNIYAISRRNSRLYGGKKWNSRGGRNESYSQNTNFIPRRFDIASCDLSGPRKIVETDEQFYSRFLSRLHCHSRLPITEDLNYLTFVLNNCIRFKNEFYFVENVLLDWWSALIYNREKISKAKFFNTIYTLQKLNTATKGGVLKRINWNSIEELAIFVLEINQRGPPPLRKYALLVHGLVRFAKDSGEKCSEILRNRLLSSLTLVVPSVEIVGKIPFAISATRIGEILHHLIELAMEKPDENLIRKIVPLCVKSIEFCRRENGRSRAFLNLICCANAMSTWNVNVDIYSNEPFWQNYYKCVEDNKNCFVNVYFLNLTLHSCLSIAYKFDKEEDFTNILRQLWIEKMNILLKGHTLHKVLKETKILIDLMKSKYADQPTKLETILSPEIIKKFDEIM